MAGDLVAHWRAQDLVADFEDGSTVSGWIDNVGSVVATGAGSPVLRHTALGGRAAIEFAPSDGIDSFEVGNLESPMSDADEFTLAVVFSTSATQLQGTSGQWYNDTPLIDAYGLGFANDWGVTLNAEGRVGVGLGQTAAAPTTLYSSQSAYNDGQTHIALFRHVGDQITLQIDDAPLESVAGASTNPRSSLNVQFGARIADAAAAFEGYIAEFRVYDGALDTAETQSLIHDLTSVYNNQAPVANGDVYTLAEDTTIFFVGPNDGVLSNDSDHEGDAITAQLIDPPQHGSLSLEPNGTIIYSPDNDFFGIDSFTYAAVDFRPSAPATVTLEVTPTYDPVSPFADTYLSRPGAVLQVDSNDGVLANDLNPDRSPLNALLVETPAQGTLNFQSDGSFSFDPQGFVGQTSFSYRVDDGTNQTAPVQVTLNVNTAPDGLPDTYLGHEDTPLIIEAAQGLLSNDEDADGDTLVAVIENDVTHGQLVAEVDGSFVYTPDENYHGSDSFSYRVTDGVETSDPVIVVIDVSSINDAPTATDDSYVVLLNQAITLSADRGVLSNDSDLEGAVLAAQLVTTPTHGAVALSPDGSFTYTPAQDFIGDDEFTYQASDNEDVSLVTRVHITVSATPLLINELMASNVGSLVTRVREDASSSFRGDDQTPDWIEIKNQVDVAVDLSGMGLSDDVDEPMKWVFPENSVIAPGGYLVVFASGDDIRDPELDEQGNLHTNFRLGADGEQIVLTGVGGATIHTLDAQETEQFPDVSYGLVDNQRRYFEAPTPGAANEAGLMGRMSEPTLSVPHGYFDAPFTVDIASESVGASLIYTTDGSIPTLENGTQVAATNPDLPTTTRLLVDRTTTLRVRAYQDQFMASDTATQSYFFTSDLVEQSNLWSTVTENPEWGPQLADSFTSVPSISLVIDGRISEAREIETSVEMIFPDGSEPGFQIDAGIEHYGGHSLSSQKKNMRLSFKATYGDSQLEYDLFGPDAANQFDQLLLRTGSHDSWFWVHPAGGQGNYVRNRWAFDRQLEMGHLAPHGRFVQVFINGDYWGLHQLMERPNASFMASYLGGDPEDYDALNAGTAIDGDTTAWRMLSRSEVMGDYEQVQQYLDVVNYADYMLLQFYAGNDWDWNHLQNWAGARKREEGAGYIFFSWDSDVMLRTTANANVIDRGGPGNLWNVRGGMKQHDEFLMLLADRAHRYFFNDGMLTNERLRLDVDAIAEQLRLPVIAETARWGRYGHGGLRYTPEVWEGAIDWMKDTYAPEGRSGRTETTLQQLRRAGIYPDVDAPEFTVDAVRQHGGQISDAAEIGLVVAEGTIYYTLDGTDPRLPGGIFNATAIQHDGGALLLDRSTTIKARAYNVNSAEWSALSEAEFRVNTTPADATNLRISELHYHPADSSEAEIAAGFEDADDFEFIELVNISDQTIDLQHVQFVRLLTEEGEQGVQFSFADSELRELAPHERLVVVENADAFAHRYGTEVPVAGQWNGGLNNRQELVTLTAGDTVVHQFLYSDAWHPTTDGDGYSLDVASLEQSLELWAQGNGWRPSRHNGGSPGRDLSSSTPVVGDSNRDGVFDTADIVLAFQAGEYEDAIAGNSTWEEGDWDGDGDFTTADLVFAFQSGNYVAGATQRVMSLLEPVDTEDSSLKTRLIPKDRDSLAANEQWELPSLTSELSARDEVLRTWL